jgi:hypothetical protein
MKRSVGEREHVDQPAGPVSDDLGEPECANLAADGSRSSFM